MDVHGFSGHASRTNLMVKRSDPAISTLKCEYLPVRMAVGLKLSAAPASMPTYCHAAL